MNLFHKLIQAEYSSKFHLIENKCKQSYLSYLLKTNRLYSIFNTLIHNKISIQVVTVIFFFTPFMSALNKPIECGTPSQGYMLS